MAGQRIEGGVERESEQGIEQGIEHGIEYAPEQLQAIRYAKEYPISIITGGPGTGKSTIINAICNQYADRCPAKPIYLAAPTGRAAKRMSETSDREAKTIHRLLLYHPEFGFGLDGGSPSRELEPGLLVVDEASMLDVELANHLFKAIPSRGMTVVLVGDVDQLPSVGPGSVLNDIIASEQVPTTYLKYNFRQAEGSKIITLAHEILQGNVPDFSAYANQDVQAKEVKLPEDTVGLVLSAVKFARRNGLGLMDFQILAPMYKGVSGVANLNNVVRELVNPARAGEREIRLGWLELRVGDKVMVTKNNYLLNVFNGDMGIVRGIGKRDSPVAAVVEIDGFEVEFDWNALSGLTLAYACSIHKSQGNQYPLVVGVFTRQHYIMLQRNLLYTAVTRARDKLFLIHQEGAIKRAVSNNVTGERYSRLRERLTTKGKGVDGNNFSPGGVGGSKEGV